MDQRFENALEQLGHIYPPYPEGTERVPRIRHIGKVFVPTGEITARCQPTDGSEGRVIACPALWPDSNCEKCRALEDVDGVFITKRSLLIDCVNILIDTEQLFLDAMYWDMHNPNEASVNPDPDGFLSEQWEQQAGQIMRMIERFRPTMAHHANRFGWPDEIVDDQKE